MPGSGRLPRGLAHGAARIFAERLAVAYVAKVGPDLVVQARELVRGREPELQEAGVGIGAHGSALGGERAVLHGMPSVGCRHLCGGAAPDPCSPAPKAT